MVSPHPLSHRSQIGSELLVIFGANEGALPETCVSGPQLFSQRFSFSGSTPLLAAILEWSRDPDWAAIREVPYCDWCCNGIWTSKPRCWSTPRAATTITRELEPLTVDRDHCNTVRRLSQVQCTLHKRLTQAAFHATSCSHGGSASFEDELLLRSSLNLSEMSTHSSLPQDSTSAETIAVATGSLK